MAQFVGYFEDDVEFAEGPFVVVDIFGYRIEVEYKGAKCPALPDVSIYRLREALGHPWGKTTNRDLAIKMCDELNALVREERIVLHPNGKCWVCPEHDPILQKKSHEYSE